MADMTAVIRLRVAFAWWLRPYLHLLAWFAFLSDRKPDEAKLKAVIRRGVRLHVGHD